MTSGLRELKKERTRNAIARHAMRLFYQRGFDATTIVEIAQASEVSPRTFFAYFPVKEMVVFPDSDVQLADLEKRLQAHSANDSAMDVLVAWLLHSDSARGDAQRRERKRRQLVRDTPALAAYQRGLYRKVEDLLADAFAAQLGAKPGSIGPSLAAASAVAAIDAIARYYDRSTRGTRTAAPFDPQAMMNEASRFLAGGIEALATSQPVTKPSKSTSPIRAGANRVR